MKNLFPEFSALSEKDYQSAWSNGVFIFDTNVLLNLYRYRTTTRDELLTILEKLSSRIWIPHHVALEFQRNRLAVLAEQNRRFSDVRRTVEKAQANLTTELDKLQLQKRHSSINPQPLTTGFENLAKTFFDDLTSLSQAQQQLDQPDPLKQRLEDLFDGKVGAPPQSQQLLDAIYAEGEIRYKQRVPPGFEDGGKEKQEINEFRHGGLVYKRKFGDFVIWRQLLDYATSPSIKSVVFVTDDGKEDWWQTINSDGPKTMGPRPELIEEARLVSSISPFVMYSSEGFLKYAKQFLAAQVSEEAIKEVRDVSNVRTVSLRNFEHVREQSEMAELAVFLWLGDLFETVAGTGSFPDFIAESSGRKVGVEVRYITQVHSTISRTRDTLYRAYFEVTEGDYTEFNIVLVVTDVKLIDGVRSLALRQVKKPMTGNIHIIIGLLLESEKGPSFVPLEKFSVESVVTSISKIDE